MELLRPARPVRSAWPRRCHLSVRNLQRKLAGHGTSLARLREEARRDTRQPVCAQLAASVGEITYLLGFSEPASSRAPFTAGTACRERLPAGTRRAVST